MMKSGLTLFAAAGVCAMSIPGVTNPLPPVACCYALNAECNACSEGVSVSVYCARNPDVAGCPPNQRFGGEAVEAFGGGGSVRCPTGLQWGGPGDYCIEDNLYACGYQGQHVNQHQLLQNCGGGGCIHAPVGRADYCAWVDDTPDTGCCRGNTAECLSCEIGISPKEYCRVWSWAAKVPDCPSYSRPEPEDRALDRFENRLPHSAVRGSNDAILHNINSAEECASRCLNEWWCLSMEYNWQAARCVLSRAIAPLLFGQATGWDLYIKKL